MTTGSSSVEAVGRAGPEALRSSAPNSSSCRKLTSADAEGWSNDHGHRQPQPGRLGEPVAQFHRGQRVEPEVPERPVVRHGVRSVEPEDLRRLRTDVPQQRGAPLGGGDAPQLLDQSRPVLVLLALVGRAGRPYLGEFTQGHQGPRGHHLPVDVRDDQELVAPVQRPLERGQCQLGLHGRYSVTAQPLAQFRGDHAAAGPGAPADRGRGQARGLALLCERVEEGVGRRVAALSWCAERAGHGGEEHERGEVQVPGGLVQRQGRVDLGPHDARGALGGQCVDHAVVEHTRGVHDSGQRLIAGQVVDQGTHRVQVGDVRRDDCRRGAATRPVPRRVRRLPVRRGRGG